MPQKHLDDVREAVYQERHFFEQLEEELSEAENDADLIDVFRQLRSYRKGDNPPKGSNWAYLMLKAHFEHTGAWDEDENYPIIED